MNQPPQTLPTSITVFFPSIALRLAPSSLLLAGRIELDHVINAHDRDGCLRRKAQGLDLADRRLHHTSRQIVTNHTCE